MAIVIHKMVQYSPEWWEARQGIPTASAFDRILTPGGKLSSQADGYINELIADRICLDPNFLTEKPISRAMQLGTDTEPKARAWYEWQMPDVQVYQVGFVHNEELRIGGSPDAMVGEDGVLELKCPLLHTHIKYLRDGVLPSEYRPQCHGHLLVTGRKWVDFVSYSTSAPQFRIRLFPDDYTEKLREALAQFTLAYDLAWQKIKNMEGK